MKRRAPAKQAKGRLREQRLRPIDIPEKLIAELAADFNIDTDEAADLVVFMYDELAA